ncbi:nose resistant to fluoxetine protein 6-like [Maniola jurtina]|uniref:nose resistant to fluoxetine protein 6-like n=1 Tax=Maniola jurtina TaxID=191418 RepID=UPI001E68F71B|nr:nose resistant to fluoxetine protein 6-like [Maniola jurtina]
MKALLLLVAINFVLTKSSVVTSTKNTDATTPSENHANFSESKTDKKHEIYKTFNVNESRIYLDDVLFALKNQNWTETEQPCLERTLLMLHNLQNFTLWAVWNWDSISSEPEGLLYGNRFHLGNFDECMRAPWYKQHPELRAQYCLSDIELERTDRAVTKAADPFNPYESALNVIEYESPIKRPLNKLTWGVCVPAVCQPKSVEKLTSVLLAHSHLGAVGLRARISVTDSCQKADEPLRFDGLFYAFIGITVCLVVTALVCTFLNNEYKKKQSNENSIKHQLIKAFDLQYNASKLLERTDQGTDVVYGIKFLSMCIIVSGHQYGIFNGGPVSNGFKVDEDALSVAGLFVLHEDIVVDSFFMLSGFLTATALAKATRIPNLFVLFFKRYIRLVVTYAVVIFFICAIYPYTGSGPLWNRAIAEDTKPCRENWWLNLLMVSNYVDSENICLVISWYIPCDYHFFVVTVLLYWFYKRHPGAGRIVAVLVLLVAIVTPGVINYLNSLPAIQLFTYDFISNPRGPKQFHLTYIKSHTRYAPYLVGFLSGYIFAQISTTGNLKKIPQKWAILGATLSILIMTVVALTGPMFLWRSYDVLESAVYAALNRPVWACSVALLVICCSLGHVPIINGFLSWFPWVPLSRLTYGLYLIHTLLIARNVYVTRNPQHLDNFNSLTSCLGVIFEASLAAFLIKLFAEAPVLNVLTICLSPRTNRHEGRNSDVENNRSKYRVNDKVTSETGHLDDNLPSTIQVISSKM